MADGSDLKKKGLFAKDQAAAPKAAKDVDNKYDQLEKEGKLTSSPWAANMPWTNQGAASYKTPLAMEKAAAKDKAAKEAKDKKAVVPKKGAAPVVVEEPVKKKFFGLF